MATYKKKTGNYHRSGKTLLVKSLREDFDLTSLELDKRDGLVSNTASKSGTTFVVFSDVKYAEAAAAILKTNSEFRNGFSIKYPKYNIFFSISGLEKGDDYSSVKQEHIKQIQEVTGCSIFSYKLYKKNDEYIGCGEVSVDLKEGMDKLLDKDGEHKNFKFGKYEGVYHKYNKSRKQNDQEATGTDGKQE